MNTFDQLFSEGVTNQDSRGISYSQIDDFKFAYHPETGYLLFNEASGEWENFNYNDWLGTSEAKKVSEDAWTKFRSRSTTTQQKREDIKKAGKLDETTGKWTDAIDGFKYNDEKDREEIKDTLIRNAFAHQGQDPAFAAWLTKPKDQGGAGWQSPTTNNQVDLENAKRSFLASPEGKASVDRALQKDRETEEQNKANDPNYVNKYEKREEEQKNKFIDEEWEKHTGKQVMKEAKDHYKYKDDPKQRGIDEAQKQLNQVKNQNTDEEYKRGSGFIGRRVTDFKNWWRRKRVGHKAEKLQNTIDTMKDLKGDTSLLSTFRRSAANRYFKKGLQRLEKHKDKLQSPTFQQTQKQKIGLLPTETTTRDHQRTYFSLEQQFENGLYAEDDGFFYSNIHGTTYAIDKATGTNFL